MDMNTQGLEAFLTELQESAINQIPAELAKKPEYAGKRIFDGVLCGACVADDSLLASFQDNKAANLDMLQPEVWLPGAKAVLSIFMSFSHWIIEENAGGDWPSDGWLHGRIEGQTASDKMFSMLLERIRAAGYEALAPSFDPRLKVFMKYAGYPESLYTSNWSERHVAFAAGLGTFGLSRGLITKRGIAGRFMSLVTTLPLEPTPRPYTELLEYCVKCGICAKNCPAQAIAPGQLKEHRPCDEFLTTVRQKEAPYYGCGKCQCGVPCATGLPQL